MALLQLRKYVVLVSGGFTLACQRVSEHVLFRLLMCVVILLNMVLFLYSNTVPEYTPTIREYQTTLLACYATECAIKLFAYGYAFLRDFWNLYDSLALFAYAYHITRPHQFIVDTSPMRMLKLLTYMGSLMHGLNVMLTAIREAIKYLAEGLMVVLIFTLFMASVGVSLFRRLFNFRCMEIETGFYAPDADWKGCGFYACADGHRCVRTFDPLVAPTNFNSIEYAYAQVLRTITGDDWTFPMYFTMRAFHP